MPYVTVENYRLHYRDYPATSTPVSPYPIIFLHGFTLDHRMWLSEAEYFSRHYRVLLPDSKGHGLSDAPESGYSRAHRVEDLLRFFDQLGIEKAHVVGLSMGGTTGLGFALKYQSRLASLALVSTSAAGYNVGPKIARIDKIAREKGIEAARKRWISTSLSWYRQDRGNVPQLLETMMLEHSGAVWKDPMRGKYPKENDLDRVHQITVPTMIFAGELDRIFLPLAHQLHELISGSRLSVYESVGHMVNLESPERFMEELKLFVEDEKSL